MRSLWVEGDEGAGKDFEPWAFVHEEVHDEMGGDPVELRQHASRLRLPSFVQGEALNSVRPGQAMLETAFGAAADIGEDAWPFITILRPEGPVEEGMIVTSHMYGFGVVVAVAEAVVPANWPLDPGGPFDRNDPSFRLVLARADLLRHPDFVRGYLADNVAEIAAAEVAGGRSRKQGSRASLRRR